MKITKCEQNGLGSSQSRSHGLGAGLTTLLHRLFNRVRLLVDCCAVPTICLIAIGLGGCSTTAPARDGQYATATGREAQYACPAGPEHCNVEPASVEGTRADERGTPEAGGCGEEGQRPCSCLTDYFASTKRPFCTAVDWLVVLPLAFALAVL
jgi:hypothetical protein